MKDHKAKGTRGERELVHFFNQNQWSCVRVAGSGSSSYPSPDLLAGNALRRLAIECKVTKEKKKYFPADEVSQLVSFSRRFGAESWIGIKFKNSPWYFIMPQDLENTGSCFAASLELVQRKGVTTEQLLHFSLQEHASSAASGSGERI